MLKQILLSVDNYYLVLKYYINKVKKLFKKKYIKKLSYK